MTHDLSKIRDEYLKNTLNKTDIDKNPIKQFEKWLNEAIASEVNQPTAMSLSTSTIGGIVSSRIILLKETTNNTFTFFTNYESKKGIQVYKNPNASLLFFWPEIERQIRIEGIISKLNKKKSNYYFSSRPKESKISALISPQSKSVPNREYLENLQEQFIKKNKELSRPSNWGGYYLTPNLFEFWQGRANRLHDRIQYTRKNMSWDIERIAP